MAEAAHDLVAYGAAARGALDSMAGERRCLVTRESGDRWGLVRCVVSPDGEVVPDISESLPGRGLWLTAHRDIVAKAVAKGLFSKAARRRVSVDPDLASRIERLLAQRCVELLGLARRGGLAVAGYAKVADALAAGRVALLMRAADSQGRDGRELAGRARDIPQVEILTGEELGRPFGRDHLVHVALAAGPLTGRVERECRRLEGFRAPSAAGQDGGSEDRIGDDGPAEPGRGET